MCQNRASGILLRDVKIVEIGHIFRLQEEVVELFRLQWKVRRTSKVCSERFILRYDQTSSEISRLGEGEEKINDHVKFTRVR